MIKKKDNLIEIVFLIVIIFIVILISRPEEENEVRDNSNLTIEERVQEKYNNSGTIDCTGVNMNSDECQYLINTSTDDSSGGYPYP